MQYEHTHTRTQPEEIFAEMPKKSSESEVKLKAAEQNEN